MSKDFIRSRSKPVSNAEIALQIALHEAGEDSFFMSKEFCLQSTKPDFYFPNENLAVYLDGEQVHRNREQKDEELRIKLNMRYGCTVRSYTYKAPITKTRLKEIVDQILDDVTGLRKLRR